MVVRKVVNNTVGAAADPWAGAAGVAADCLAGGSPQVRAGCSCPAAASAGADVADAAAMSSAGAAVDCDNVAVAVVGDGCVVVAVVVTVAGPRVVGLRKLLPTLPDNAAAPDVGVVGAVELLEYSWPVQAPAATMEVVRT